jgi:hypothetical protein
MSEVPQWLTEERLPNISSIARSGHPGCIAGLLDVQLPLKA